MMFDYKTHDGRQGALIGLCKHGCAALLGGAVFVLAVTAPVSVSADVYSYVTENGDYVVSPKKPKRGTEYAVLDDEGNFIRLVSARDTRVPITHWRPWYLPKEPHPFDAQPTDPAERETNVEIEEVDKRADNE